MNGEGRIAQGKSGGFVAKDESGGRSGKTNIFLPLFS